MAIEQQHIAIFGSVLTSATPRDIDVACVSGYLASWLPEHEQMVRDWAAAKGLPADLPIDRHELIWGFQYSPRSGAKVVFSESQEQGQPCLLQLPAPCGRKDPYEVLLGNIAVEYDQVWSISAILRVFGHSGVAFRSAVEKLGRMGTLFGPMIDIGKADEELDLLAGNARHFDNYLTGVVSLRSAILHASAWEEILAHPDHGFIRFLNGLATFGPTPEGVAYARQRSSGAGARLLLREREVTTQYGDAYPEPKSFGYGDAYRFFVGADKE